MRKWETEDWSNGVMYYHPIENAYYCMNCNTYMYKSGEWERVGSIDESKQLLRLCKSLLEKLREYVKKEKLELRWSIYWDEEKVVQEKLKIIESELNEVLKDGRLKDIAKIEKNTFSLKDQIISSELFSRYLIHKEMNTLRMNENNTTKQWVNSYDYNLNGDKRKEDQMNTIGEYCEELKRVMQSKQNFNNDNIEGLLESWKEKINNKNKQKEDDRIDKENKIIIYEDETKHIQKKGKEVKSKKLKSFKSISYDVLILNLRTFMFSIGGVKLKNWSEARLHVIKGLKTCLQM